MVQLTPITLDDGTRIYIQANDAIVLSDPEAETSGRVPKGAGDIRLPDAESIKDTIKSYTAYTLDAFKELSNANIQKVTLEFGVTIAGKAGIPYITEGSMAGNLKVTVECVFGEKGNREGVRG